MQCKISHTMAGPQCQRNLHSDTKFIVINISANSYNYDLHQLKNT